MSEMEAALLLLGEVADTNPETLPATTPTDFRFRYIDLSAVEAGFINWGAVSETTYSGAPSRARRVVQPMDVLYGTVRPNLQSHGFIGVGQVGPLVASTGFSVVRAKSGVSHPAYLFHSLMSCSVTAQAVRNAVGSSYPALNDSDVKRFQLFVPPYQEQEVAAQILDTLDTAIRETEALIDKLKAVKQGLLHDLLTRGIDASGQLRPPQSEAPQLYKESPLGWIPREWECVRLAEKLAVLGGKRLPAGHSYADLPTSFKYLRVTDFFERDYMLDELENLYERTFKALERYEIRPGQLYISIAGSLGHIGVHRADGAEAVRTVLTENAARLVPQCDLNPDFLAAYMNSGMVQNQVTSEKGTGGGVPKLALFRIEQFWLVWPSTSEQNLIAERVLGVNKRISDEIQMLRKLKLEKSGLMDDLLTGRVRVTPLLESVQQAAAQTGA